MHKVKVDTEKVMKMRRYDWMALEVGEGYQTPSGGPYPKMARDYCARRGEDREFSQTRRKGKGGSYTFTTFRTK